MHPRNPRRRPSTAVVLLATGSLFSSAVLGAPGFGALLKGTNFAALGEADMKAFLNMAETTVASQPDGVDVHWASDKSGAASTMRVPRSFQRDGRSCRELAGDTTVKGRTEPFRITYCKDPSGRWRLDSPGAP